MDFREALYQRYASSFKEAHGLDDPRAFAGYEAWARRKLLPVIEGVDRHAAVLELGCGSGPMLELLRRSGYANLRGVDTAPEMVERACVRGLRVERADVVSFLRSSSDTFQLIMALDFLEHFRKEELLPLVRLIHDRLAPGGALLIQTPNGEGLMPGRVVHGDLTHLTVFTPSSLEQLLRVEGFGAFQFFETGPVAKSLRGVVRVALWRVVRGVATAVKLIETGGRQAIWTENLICFCRRG
jgi:SAM-dependent methyltransferase